MTALLLHCVVDTNVATTANGSNPEAPPGCVAASARALREIVKGGHVFIDDSGLIIAEYRKNLSAKSEPGAGHVFFKWLLTSEWVEDKVTHVHITPKPGEDEEFEELPARSDGGKYDRSDHKFLAVAAAHPDRPPILQAFDSKWWGWTVPLAEIGVQIHFLCPEDIQKKHAEKMGK